MSAPWPDLAGRVTLRPGATHAEALVSTRPDLVARLTTGRPAAQLPSLLGTVFTLCSQAHRWTAQSAVQAALGHVTPTRDEDRQAHRLATLREHLMRLWHDWPRLLPGAPSIDGAALLRDCPVWIGSGQTDERLAAMPAWLAAQGLGPTPQAWLDALASDPAGAALRWSGQGPGALARLLASQREAAQVLAAPAIRLDLLADPTRHLPALAQAMADQAGFCARPHWQGAVPDTGPWDRQALSDAAPVGTAWDRLIGRVAETARLALPGGESALAHGALTLAPGVGVAWTEMARGLLVHRVALNMAGPGEPSVAACQVLAPTEWNFHPQGVLAGALRRLPPGPHARDAATRLAVAFDPCVPFDIECEPQMSEDQPARMKEL